MIRRYLSVCCVASLSLSQAMPLDKVIQTALHHSTVIQKSKNQQELMRLKREEKRSAKYGELDAVASFTHYNLPRTLAPLTPSVMQDPVSAANVTVSEDIATAGIRYSVPLFTGFAMTQDIKMADIADAMAKAKFRLGKEELVYNISSLYVTVLSLKETAKAQQNYIQALRRLRKSVEVAVNHGKKAPLDLLKIDAQIAQVEASKASVQGNIQALKATLEALANVHISRFEPVKVRMRPLSYTASSKRLDRLLKMKLAKLQTNKAEHAYRKSKAAYYPHVAFSGYYGYNYGKNDQKDRWDNENLWQAGINASWNISDFGVRKSRREQAKIALMQARLDEVQTQWDVKKSLRQADAKLKEAQSAYRSASAQYRVAREGERIEAIRYENGSSSINDLLYAKANLFMAKASKIHYLYEWQKAYYFLNYLLERGVKQ